MANLRQRAHADMRRIMTNKGAGFGWDVVLTDPAGLSAPLVGFSNDISQAIDPETGQIVSGRVASVALPMSDILAAGMTVPRSVAENTSKPWAVQFLDIDGQAWTFHVHDTQPDRALGIVVCMLADYRP